MMTITTKIRRPRRRRRYQPTLRYSPTAWAKLLYLRDRGPTEIGGFGISVPGDPLRIDDVVLVPQTCTQVTVKFDDLAVAEFFDLQIDQGRKPEQFARVWIHTHPGDSAAPSHTDDETFDRAFGQCDWAVMAILARGGESFARLRFNRGPQADLEIATKVDWSGEFSGSDHAGWQAEYEACVRPDESSLCTTKPVTPELLPDFPVWDDDLTASFWDFSPSPTRKDHHA